MPVINETISITIFITTSDGVNVRKLTVQPAVDTAQQVCSRISKITQIPVNRQQLLFAGQELKRDGLALAEYGVTEESKLHLVCIKKRQ